MPSRHCLIRLALVVLALSLLPSAAGAETKARSFELGAFYTYVHFDGETQLQYRWAPSLLVGYNFTRKNGIEAMGTMGTATPWLGSSFATDFSIFRLGYVRNFSPKEKITSLFRMGVGRWASNPERVSSRRVPDDPNAEDPNMITIPLDLQAPTDNSQHFFFYLGGGVRFMIKDWIAIRLAGSFDVINTTGGLLKSDTQGTADLGVVFFLGGRDTDAQPTADGEKPKEEKPKEEKPKEEVKPPLP